MKYLIAGLGNIGAEYQHTRHNVGFMVLDAMASSRDVTFSPDRYASVAGISHKGRKLILIKPATFMNLSGKTVRYWLQKENIPLENLLVITDDLALNLGTLRLRSKGGDGGHNGLTDIIAQLGTQEFHRLRVGIGSEFSRGQQVDYVLGSWSDEELVILKPRLKVADEMVLSFVTAGPAHTMNRYNK
jgi:peptidyl-tRNA hydrolase, PTH1 family